MASCTPSLCTGTLRKHISVNYPRATRERNHVRIMRPWFRAHCHQNQIRPLDLGRVYVSREEGRPVHLVLGQYVHVDLQGAPRLCDLCESRSIWAGRAQIARPKGTIHVLLELVVQSLL